MSNRDPARLVRLRIEVCSLVALGDSTVGKQSRLAERYGVSRQRVHQIVVEEKDIAAGKIEPKPLKRDFDKLRQKIGKELEGVREIPVGFQKELAERFHTSSSFVCREVARLGITVDPIKSIATNPL